MNVRPGGGPKIRLRTAERAKRAAELVLRGLTYNEIAKELGLRSKSAVYELIERYRTELPRAELEEVRTIQMAKANRAQDAACELLAHKDPKIRLQAANVVVRAADTLGRLSGAVKVPAPIVNVNMAPTGPSYDLSRLTVEEIAQLRALRVKMLAGEQPVEAEGHEVIDAAHEIEKPEPENPNGKWNREDGEPAGSGS